MSKKVLIAHAGKQHSYHVARNLLELGVLQKFITSSYVASPLMQRLSGNFLRRRFLEGLTSPWVESHWKYEMREFLHRKLKGKDRAFEELVYRRDKEFDKYVATRLGVLKPSVFWGFQGSCRDTLKRARELGIYSYCELATAHITSAVKILEEEAKLQPEWADSINNMYFPDFARKRMEEEPFLADKVVAASAFTRKTLVDAGLKEEKIQVLPLGFELDHIAYHEKRERLSGRPLRLLYAGTVSQRKGISYLLEAMRSFRAQDVQLNIYGHIEGNGEAFGKYKGPTVYHGAVSQQELFSKYTEYDALVLPTVFEGFGLVIVEALAAGLPVITTPHSIGPDVISDGKNGRIVPVRDIAALRSAIEWLRGLGDDAYQEASMHARAAAMSYTWAKHKELLGNLFSKAV